ncbi:cytidylyltransferase domain-containing protein [Lonepinella sp. BR2919]|uniref:cytidylyltransferase domain-containing protein n=1 Tax=unclassified Lonepinella TaxID=2642006 RepID=UPI003F6DC908
MKKIAIITARAGSKGLPNKNVLLANSKPLMAYSIEAAIESKEFEKIIVTTDSQEYIDLLSYYPIEFVKRAPHLSTDTASSFVALEDVILKYQDFEYDYFVQLQPTSPLRTAQHIKEACQKFEKNYQNFDFLVSVSNAHKPTTLTRIIDEDESLKYFQLDYSNYARQQYKPEYSPNGAFFVAKPQAYLKQKHFYGEKCIAYFMDKDVSIDIDDRQDFEYFYYLIQQQNKENILLNNIKFKIQLKRELFNQVAPITLIGHSILDNWSVRTINGENVLNLGISGISTKQYIDLILDKGLIKRLGSKVVLMLGTNDIVKENWTKENILNDIQYIVNSLKEINVETEIYFLEISLTAFRADRSNTDIIPLNHYIKENLQKVKWVSLNNRYADKYGKLDMQYTDDGLHFNQKGYELLADILGSELK